jgi:Zn-dependent protease
LGKNLSIKIHYSWVLVLALVTLIVTTQFPENYLLWQRVMLGIVVSLVFLAAVAIREFVFYKVSIPGESQSRKITLFFFGGVYPDNKAGLAATQQPLAYLARFLSNLVIAVIFYGLYATFISVDNIMLSGVAQWLTYIYFLFFLLHFIPAFPLDGGKILRTVLWKNSGDYYKATDMASFIGWAAGLFLIFAGVLVFIITKEWIISLVIVSIGWILEIAASYTRREVKTHQVLQNIKAEDIMTREYPVLPQQVNIGQLVREHILIKGWPYVIVSEGNQLKGMLTLKQIKSVPGKHWNDTTIGDIMITSDQIMTAHLQQPADTLFEEMHQRKIDYIPVLGDNNIAGVIDRVALMSLVKTRIGFGA